MSDGTSAGTQILKDINPGSSNSDPYNFTPYNSKLYFSAKENNTGIELWVTDGTSSGTIIVKDIVPGTFTSSPRQFTELNGKLYFVADAGSLGNSLFVTDGTNAGTMIVKRIYNGSTSGIHSIKSYRNKLYFKAEDSLLGRELFVSDGTDTGTKLFKDIIPGLGGSLPTDLFVYKNRLYFRASSALNDVQLWQTDGTVSGTFVVAPPNANANALYIYSQAFDPLQYSIYNNAAFFGANYNSNGFELWMMQDTTTSIARNTPQNSFSLYPNPNKGTFTVEVNNDFEKASVHVYDVMGREVYQSAITNSKFPITLNQPNGIYMVKLQLDDAVLTKRVVVE
jgi:ELWxxDGT repeat protein